jgi:hypothetical protein
MLAFPTPFYRFFFLFGRDSIHELLPIAVSMATSAASGRQFPVFRLRGRTRRLVLASDG